MTGWEEILVFSLVGGVVVGVVVGYASHLYLKRSYRGVGE